MKRRRQPVSRPEATINITSLLDITFVLLIAFMIVAPALKHGIEIDLPEVRDAPSLADRTPIAVIVKHGGSTPLLYVDGEVVELDILIDTINLRRELSPDKPITLEADKDVDWNQMAMVIGALKIGGVGNVGILTQPPRDA